MADPPGVQEQADAGARATTRPAGGVVLGIDFGTSYTSAGAFIDGRVELVRDNGEAMIPSVAYVPARGEMLIGARALPHALSEPQHTVASVKRLLGERRDPEAVRQLAPTAPYQLVAGPDGQVMCRLHNQVVAPEQIAAAILAHVRTLAERRFGPVSRVVMSVSAVASASQRLALRKAARLAHLDVLEMVAEPIAGAVALGLHARRQARRLVVCDFGGGTFDVSAIEQAGPRFNVLATGGDPFLGGDDLDQAMVQAMAGLVYRRARFDVNRDLVRQQLLAFKCEAVKRVLSSRLEARLTMLDAFIEQGSRRDIDVIIERSWCEALWQPLFERALAEVERVLARIGWADGDIHEIALIGGASLVPRFQELLRERFSATQVTVSDNAHVAVACGAALVAARHAGPSVVAVSTPAAPAA